MNAEAVLKKAEAWRLSSRLFTHIKEKAIKPFGLRQIIHPSSLLAEEGLKKADAKRQPVKS